VQRAGIEADHIDDVVMSSVLTAGFNIPRQAALAARLPATVAAQTIDRQCASGLMATATRQAGDV
jgi:acetyl-CoA C-acetyltransferase/acetyl-CoA acyltransferase